MPRRIPGLFTLLATLLLPLTAAAVGEGERQLSIQFGPALFGANSASQGGAMALVDGHQGLTDSWAARVAMGLSVHPLGADPVRASTVSAGFTYALDIVRVIPFADLALAFQDLRGNAGGRGLGRRDLGFEVGLGGEYLLAPRWTLALVGHYRLLPVSLGGADAGGAPWLLSVGLRLGRIF
jgi:hypothetical protein